jgi:hypothetical protein
MLLRVLNNNRQDKISRIDFIRFTSYSDWEGTARQSILYTAEQDAIPAET